MSANEKLRRQGKTDIGAGLPVFSGHLHIFFIYIFPVAKVCKIEF
jgi:hypothetical protein